MGFTAKLLLAYILLLALTVPAFIKKKKLLAMLFLGIMLMGIIALFYLLLISPM